MRHALPSVAIVAMHYLKTGELNSLGTRILALGTLLQQPIRSMSHSSVQILGLCEFSSPIDKTLVVHLSDC